MHKSKALGERGAKKMDVSVQVVLTNLDLQACTFVFGKFRLKILGYSKSSNTKYALGISSDLEISTHVLHIIGRYRTLSKRGDFNARNSRFLKFYR